MKDSGWMDIKMELELIIIVKPHSMMETGIKTKNKDMESIPVQEDSILVIGIRIKNMEVEI